VRRTQSAAERRFRGESDRWDRIYSEAAPLPARLWDRWTRQNVRLRFARTFELAGDLRGRSVLDLGCGSGRYLVEALERGAGRVVGVDFAPEMLEQARSLIAGATNPERCELLRADVATLDLDERFDLVIANGLFDYVDDAPVVLGRAVALARGSLVATFPDRRALRALPRWLYWRARGLAIHLFEPAGIAALAHDRGLGEIAIERIGPIHLLHARCGGS
jgi:SAM-dependent methyltransferase